MVQFDILFSSSSTPHVLACKTPPFVSVERANSLLLKLEAWRAASKKMTNALASRLIQYLHLKPHSLAKSTNNSQNPYFSTSSGVWVTYMAIAELTSPMHQNIENQKSISRRRRLKLVFALLLRSRGHPSCLLVYQLDSSSHGASYGMKDLICSSSFNEIWI
jgi:hypothetical protein